MLYYDTNLEFKGATLLSSDEASTLLTEQERKYIIGWWLRTPGNHSYYMCYVYGDGNVCRYGINVSYDRGIRPALQIANLGNFKVGDIFSIGDYYFKIISPTRAWMYLQDIGTDYFDEKSNNYKASHVKQIIDSWFKELKEEMK